MGVYVIELLTVIAVFSSGISGAHNNSGLDGNKLFSPNYSSSSSSNSISVSKNSKDNSIPSHEPREEYIEIIDTNSVTAYDRESLKRFGYNSFDENNRLRSSSHSTREQSINAIRRNLFLTTKLKTESCSDSSEDFPNVFTVDDLKHGALVIVIIVGIYCFTILAIICDKYFLPCMEVICEVLNLPQDVAAATFMSIATSTPELFVNIIGTFVTKSDLGVGTIVGSSLFNTLGVASIGSLAAAKPIQLGWWPLTRDTIIYMSAICLLITITWDNIIYWYEGLTLFVVYFFYFTVMFNNHRIWRMIENFLPKKENAVSTDNHVHNKDENGSISSRKVSTISPYGSYMEDVHQHSLKNFPKSSLVLDGNTTSGRVSTSSPYGSYMEDVRHSRTAKNFDRHINDLQIKDPENNINRSEERMHEIQKEEDINSVFKFPRESGFWGKCLWIYIFPIKFVLRLAIPNPRKHPKLFPLTFIMCIVFIGLNSYVVSWMITLIGAVFQIPDAVLGFTFLAAGGCLPESISIAIMSRRGEGSMGVSNSLGANTMNILMSLGLPWFLHTISMGTDNNAFINIQSGSMEYVIVGLIFVAMALYITLYFNKFQLRKRVGVILSVIYLTFVTVAIVAEMLTNDC